MQIEPEVFCGRRVLVTGHTGFKGSWLSEWLLALGAEVWGYSLPPPTTPSLFDQLDLARRIHRHQIGDVRDGAAVAAFVQTCQPSFVFHLAAQSLVRLSYDQPVETFRVNVMGTAHVLEALRGLNGSCAAVIITTDKCYENREWLHGYREEDSLGGHDPYSSSKAAAEILTAAYRRSFFSPDRIVLGEAPPVAVASARAGNVVGGGDWARDRIVPDCMRALTSNEVIAVRNPLSTRPWQHVLEPLGGYLTLAMILNRALADRSPAGLMRLNAVCSAFNFGPSLESNRSVRDLVGEVLLHWPGRWEDRSEPLAVHEATLLNLAADKAFHLLRWSPSWAFSDTVKHTVGWYREIASDRTGLRVGSLTREQIAAYQRALG